MMAHRASVLPGFFLSGFVFALLGAFLPGWNYHVTEQHALAGWLFFAVGGGILVAQQIRRLLAGLSPRPLRLCACLTAAAALIFLGILPPPVRFTAQCSGFFALGFAGGLLNISLFESIHQDYREEPASTLTRAGIYFGAGCLASAVTVGAVFRWGFVPQLLLALAAVPILFGLFYFRQTSAVSLLEADLSVGEVLRAFSRPGALVFALLLFFQSGSEWTIAGWLPLFLTHRIGISPENALWMLALYWLALLIGRIVTFYLLAHVRHGRILFASAAAALLGCLLLVSTDNSLGAAASILLLGGGFAAVYPLLAEKMGSRFPTYHPGVFNSIFSFALAGGMLFPWTAGLLASSISLTAIMLIPAAGISLVVVLLLVLWLESKVTGR